MIDLDTAIQHAEEVAEANRKQAEDYKNITPIATQCRACAEEHEQLASWLRELKDLREEHNNATEVLQGACKFRAFRYKEDDHTRGEIYCQKPPRVYGYEPECNFQCLKCSKGDN